jgi:hypothetical protein
MDTLIVKAGDDWVMSGALTSGGVATDLTDCTIAMQVRKAPSADYPAVVDATVAGGEVVIDALAGTFVITIADTVTSSIDPGEYVADIETTWADGTKTSSETFRVRVVADVTR